MTKKVSKWELTEEVEAKFTPIVKEFIDENEGADLTEEDQKDNRGELDLTDTELNPYTLWKLLEKLGYKKDEMEINGWEIDFWITFVKEGFKSLEIDCTGITFEMKLNVKEY